jgi:hypothetical protein
MFQAPVKPRSASKRTAASFPTPSTTFTSTKRDKRTIKHSILVSKARTSSDKSGGIKKRRRPSKKLATDIQTLADALPDEFDEVVPSQSSKLKSQPSSTQMQSIGSRKGIKKQIQRVVKEEQDRFGKNLAVLSQAAPSSTTIVADPSRPAEKDSRWAALRKHLAGTVGTV